MGLEGQAPPMPPVEIEGEDELERLSEAELRAMAAGSSSENWSTRTNDVLSILKKEFDSQVVSVFEGSSLLFAKLTFIFNKIFRISFRLERFAVGEHVELQLLHSWSFFS